MENGEEEEEFEEYEEAEEDGPKRMKRGVITAVKFLTNAKCTQLKFQEPSPQCTGSQSPSQISAWQL